jgi:hypothetical protein
MTLSIAKPALLLLVALAAGCTTMGIGSGSTPSGTDPVRFSWVSSDPVSGTMDATLSDGKTYTGQFFQITKDTTVDSIGPLWSGWHSRWGGWSHWDSVPSTGFVKEYSGRVVANLGGASGDHMRCNFRLVRPSEGMSGGGRGQCQLPDGNSIGATFPKA